MHSPRNTPTLARIVQLPTGLAMTLRVYPISGTPSDGLCLPNLDERGGDDDAQACGEQ